VVYERGSASVTEIAASLRDVTELLFIAQDSDHNAGVFPVLAEFGQVVRASGDIAADATVLREFGPEGLVTFSEAALRYAARLAAELGLPFHSLDTAHALTDKFEQRERLRSAGVDSVRCARIATAKDWWPALERTGMPAVVKPAWGGGSEDTYLVDDSDAARKVYAALFDRPDPRSCFVAEEFLTGRAAYPYGDYVSVESLCGPAGPAHMAVTGKFPLEPPFRECGQFWPSALPAAEEAHVLAHVTEALDALDVRTGIAHTEVKLTEDGPRIIEVNGRLGGNLQELAMRSGTTDMVLANGLSALDETVQVKLATPDKVYFQYMYLTPTRSCRMTAANGIKALRKIPGITAYRATIRPGDRVTGGVGTAQIGQLYGVAEDHESMFEILGAALAELSFDFIGATGDPFTLTRSSGQPRKVSL
jgi:biotin carboxylase